MPRTFCWRCVGGDTLKVQVLPSTRCSLYGDMLMETLTVQRREVRTWRTPILKTQRASAPFFCSLNSVKNKRNTFNLFSKNRIFENMENTENNCTLLAKCVFCSKEHKTVFRNTFQTVPQPSYRCFYHKVLDLH